jgi:DNA polymerase III delta prime subunit
MSGHHAYICRTKSIKPEVTQPLIDELQVSDVRFVSTDVVGIDDARSIIQYANVRPVTGTHQLVVICTRSIRIEAQHALLKVLEEPPASAKFIVCVPSDLYLLPTLLSRLQEYTLPEDLDPTTNTDFETFCSMSYKDRIEHIKKRIDKKDTVWVEEIKKGLVTKLSSIKEGSNTYKLARYNMVVENLNARGASNKFLLEELALSLPVTES